MSSSTMHNGSDRPMNGRPTRVTAFVDWNTQILNARVRDAAPHKKAARTLQKTMQLIGRSLARRAPDSFHVILRLYHGWHKGWEPTENLRAMISTVSTTDFSALARTPNVVWSSNVQYGHTLLAALPERTHVRPPIHLPDTYRRQARNEPRAEKMVDTALAADLLDWARRGENEWALVLSEDDDIVPPLFTAEAWIRPCGGRVFLVRASLRHTAYLKLDGLLME